MKDCLYYAEIPPNLWKVSQYDTFSLLTNSTRQKQKKSQTTDLLSVDETY